MSMDKASEVTVVPVQPRRAKRSAQIRLHSRTPDQVRQIMLQYFYDRHINATSSRGKKGFAVKIMNVRAELKASHSLSHTEVLSNLNYLLGQKWIVEEQITKSVPTRSGTVVPQSTSFYKITAAGVDKIEGTSEYTMTKFHDIKIEATGQNIITLGDGNRVNAAFADLGKALTDLRTAITSSKIAEIQKMDFVADIETIESQLARSTPIKAVIAAAWDSLKAVAVVDGCVSAANRVATLVSGYLT